MIHSVSKIIGASCKKGQKKDGVHNACAYLSKHFVYPERVTYINDFETGGYNNLFDLHNKYLHLHWRPITVGGDHSISLSTVASSVEYFKDDLTVVWVDAHADLHTRESSESGNLHGMPLGSLLGHDNIYNLPTIKPEQLIYIGLRDVEPYEQKIIDDLNIESYSMKYLQNNSLKDVLTNIYNRSETIHLSFDVDSLDPSVISSTGTPVKNGLTLEEATLIINKLAPKIISSDIVEFNPELGDNRDVIIEALTVIKLIDLLE